MGQSNITEANLALIALIPLVGALATYLVGTWVKRDLAGWIATAASALSFGFVIQKFLQLGTSDIFEDNLFLWFSIDNLSVDFTLRFDQLTAVMCLVITGIGSLIHLYSIAYMAEDEGRPRFFAYLNLFMFSMLLLVLGGNLPVLFVGWEGVGLCSYLLIGFWFKNPAYAAAGRKAFVVNRIGDLGFMLGMFLLYREFGTLDFIEINSRIGEGGLIATIPGFDFAAFCALVSGCLFVGATGKSAQIPLFVWLPDAMAGPTPVSALIHAATMVTAGVYMMARLNPLFTAAPVILAVVLVIAVLTAIIAALTAVTQNDIKKVLAYSTVSQLGFMFMAAGAGAYWVAIFHLITHAFFKACLFLTAGSVIHGCHHEQDMRKMGGLKGFMPITTATYGISVLAIAGIFPFSGYQSKHAILGALEHLHNDFVSQYAHLIFVLASISAFITAFYMARSFAMTFMGTYRGAAHSDNGHDSGHHHDSAHSDDSAPSHASAHSHDSAHSHHHEPHESPLLMTIPLMILAGLAAVGGLALGGAFGEHLSLQHYLQPVLGAVKEEHHAEGIVSGLLGSWVGILGVVIGILAYTKFRELPGRVYLALGPIGRLSSEKFYFDEIYRDVIVTPLAGTARVLWRVFDQWIVDGAVNGTAAFVDMTGEVTRQIQTGQVRHYAFFMLVGTVAILVFCFLL